MAKTYYLKFGSGSPANYTGLSPTFTIFSMAGLTSIAGPAISEMPAGSGIYTFSYEPATSVVFVADGGSALAAGDRYITNALDPIQAVDERVGTTSDSFGSTSVDPTTLLGYAKRGQEILEGNAVFNKSTGVWDIYSRGSSTLLREKTLTNTVSQATKT